MYDNQTDVLIITAIKDESDIIRAVESDWQPRDDSKGFTYYTRKDSDNRGNEFSIALARPIDMGGDFAASLATRLVNELKPRCLSMAGICAGRRGKVFLGDVVLAERVFRYDGGKLDAFREGKERAENVFQDIRTYNLNPLWIHKAQDFSPDWTDAIKTGRPLAYHFQELWLLYALHEHETGKGIYPAEMPERKEFCPDYTHVLNRLEEKGFIILDEAIGKIRLTDEGRRHVAGHRIRNPDGIPPEPDKAMTHVAPMGTGSQVKKDPELFPTIAKHVRKVLAVDMEAAAIGAVAEIENVDFCIIAKAVSDYADHEKDDHFRFYSIEASYRFLMAFLKENLPYSPEKTERSVIRLSSARDRIMKGKDHRLRRKLERLENQEKLLNEKLRYLQNAHDIKADGPQKFELKKETEQCQKALEEVENKIDMLYQQMEELG